MDINGKPNRSGGASLFDKWTMPFFDEFFFILSRWRGLWDVADIGLVVSSNLTTKKWGRKGKFNTQLMGVSSLGNYIKGGTAPRLAVVLWDLSTLGTEPRPYWRTSCVRPVTCRMATYMSCRFLFTHNLMRLIMISKGGFVIDSWSDDFYVCVFSYSSEDALW